MGLVNTTWDALCVLVGMGRVWSSQLIYIFWIPMNARGLVNKVKVHFKSTLAWEVFGQEKLNYILCPWWNRRGLVITNRDAFWVFAGMGSVWSTQVELHFFVLLVMGRVCSTQVEIHFVSPLTWDGFGQHNLRYILCSRCHGTRLVITTDIHFLSSHGCQGFGQQS